jgi:hypothetical protein
MRMASSFDTQMRSTPRKHTPCSLESLTRALLEPSLQRAGFAQSDIIVHWPQIVGAEFARVSIPLSLSFPSGARRGGKLKVRIIGAMALSFQHVHDVILERINTYYGWQAIARIVLHHGPVPPQRTTPCSNMQLPIGMLPQEITALPDGALKDALAAAWAAKPKQ